MSTFDDWLDARDGRALEAAWTALAATTIEIGPVPVRGVSDLLGFHRTGHAATQLASAWLGMPIEKIEWLAIGDELDLDRKGAPPAIFKDRRNVDFSFLEHEVKERDVYEVWDIRELRTGKRGAQRVYLGWGRSDGSRDGGEGGRGTVMRFYDRELQIGVCIPYYSRRVSFIGSVDVDKVVAPLDLFGFSINFRMPAWTTFDVDKARGLVAQLATEFDAHFDQSASWPQEVLADSGDGRRRSRYAHGPHAVHVGEDRPDGTVDIRLEGLPWGYDFDGGMRFLPESGHGYFNVRLPEESAMRMLARLWTIEGIQID